ncbi:MAG: hypothetical protein JRD89_16530 [Deltaproteobacteria bacterium]|nr:hypothetical protein [Deltaproteobacteria bacterium]
MKKENIIIGAITGFVLGIISLAMAFLLPTICSVEMAKRIVMWFSVCTNPLVTCGFVLFTTGSLAEWLVFVVASAIFWTSIFYIKAGPIGAIDIRDALLISIGIIVCTLDAVLAPTPEFFMRWMWSGAIPIMAGLVFYTRR